MNMNSQTHKCKQQTDRKTSEFQSEPALGRVLFQHVLRPGRSLQCRLGGRPALLKQTGFSPLTHLLLDSERAEDRGCGERGDHIYIYIEREREKEREKERERNGGGGETGKGGRMRSKMWRSEHVVHRNTRIGQLASALYPETTKTREWKQMNERR